MLCGPLCDLRPLPGTCFVFVGDVESLENLLGEGAWRMSMDDASRFTANLSMGPVVGVLAFGKRLLDLEVDGEEEEEEEAAEEELEESHDEMEEEAAAAEDEEGEEDCGGRWRGDWDCWGRKGGAVSSSWPRCCPSPGMVGTSSASLSPEVAPTPSVAAGADGGTDVK